MLCFVLFCFLLCGASLCSSETYSVDQAGLKLRVLPDSASGVLRLKACITKPKRRSVFNMRMLDSIGQDFYPNSYKLQTCIKINCVRQGETKR